MSFAFQQDHEKVNAFTLMMERRSQEAFPDYQQAELGVLMGAFDVLWFHEEAR